MKRIVDVIAAKADLLHGAGAADQEIMEAEKALDVCFSEEYRDYLRTFGICAYDGHELTGISSAKRTDIVEVTRTEKQKNPMVPADFYVIEQANIDRIVIWQAGDEGIYATIAASTPEKISDSLTEYIDGTP